MTTCVAPAFLPLSAAELAPTLADKVHVVALPALFLASRKRVKGAACPAVGRLAREFLLICGVGTKGVVLHQSAS